MPTNDDDLGAISDAALAAETEFESNPDARLAAVEERLAALEALQEDESQRQLAGAELVIYIKELRDELKDLRKLRSIYGFVAVCLIALFVLILIALVFVSGSPLYELPQYPAATVLVVIVTGIVILTLSLVKGVHRSSVDKGKEDTNVDYPHLVVDLVKQFGR